MTLKEELEILRGEPIEVFTGNPMDIPCVETSDSEKLCKRPVVSVLMITYNHGPYIRQAIEGVMMQKTDFEFELIIGEDCSQDKTREICFEYQRRYPDKIRVLWWHENVSKLGGNGRRCRARCRGEFIAFCEGDDYWVDSLKLQKQVDVMRKYSNVGVCFTACDVFEDEKQCINVKRSDHVEMWPKGVFPGRLYNENRRALSTCTAMIRKTALIFVRNKYDVFSWRLYLGDMLMWRSCAMHYDFYCLHEVTAVYRKHFGGITSRRPFGVSRDAGVIHLYISRMIQGNLAKQYRKSGLELVLKNRCRIISLQRKMGERYYSIMRILNDVGWRCLLKHVDPFSLMLAILSPKFYVFYDLNIRRGRALINKVLSYWMS